MPGSLWANPSGGSVAAGTAAISGGAGQLTISQTSKRAIINWQDFSVGAGELTRFVQPDAASATLNRVISGNPSSLFGSLQANGHVYLINPNGILVGAGASIDTAGFLASTLNVADHDFLQGGDLLLSGDSTAAVQNLGAISATGGDIFLVARKVENKGSLSAVQGTAALAAGSEILLTSGGPERVFIRAATAPGEVINTGVIAGATAELKAAGGNPYALAINNTGQVRANGTATRDGQLWLVAGTKEDASTAHVNNGTASNTGTLSATNADGTGGFVETSGQEVVLTGSVQTGKGGQWLIDPTDVTVDGTNAPGFVSSLNAGTNVRVEATGNVNVATAVTAAGTGDLSLVADTGRTGTGTVSFSGAGAITNTGGGDVNIFYNPTSYATPTNYTGNVTLSGGGLLTAYMWVHNVNQLQAMNTNLAGAYALSADIDASATSTWNGGAGFAPIGNASTPYSGVFDGQNHVITDVQINRSASDIGLWGVTSASAIIRSLGVVGGSINGASNVGGLVGRNAGQLIQVYTNNTVTAFGGNSNRGGLAGANSGSIDRSYSLSNLPGLGTSIGGLIGYNTGNVNLSYAAGDLLDTGSSVGGLIGTNSGNVIQSYATGSVSTPVGGTLGGLIGFNAGGNIQQSYATGDVSGGTSIGGLVGVATGTTNITQSYATGDVLAGNIAGGLVGSIAYGTISQSYATGFVVGNNTLGGLVGSVDTSATITSSYWDKTVNSALALNNGGGAGLTTAQLQDGSYATVAGFDGSVWGLKAGRYPLLRWQLPQVTVAGNLAGANGQSLALALGGQVVKTTTSDTSGNYSFTFGSDNAADTQALIYASNPATGAIVGNRVVLLPDAGTKASPTTTSNVTVTPSTVWVQSKVPMLSLLIDEVTALKGTLADNGILYSRDVNGNLVLNAAIDIKLQLMNAAFTIDRAWDLTGHDLVLNGAGGISAAFALKTDHFTLEAGNWSQVAPILPAFTASDFTLNGGTFVRALGGSGLTSSPYQLTDVYGLQGAGTLMFSSFVLNNNIYADGTNNSSNTANWNAGLGFAPIGNNSTGNYATEFRGTLDGAGHTINGLTINSNGSYVGLIGYLDGGAGGTVKNIGMVGGSITGLQFVGGLVGVQAGGSISNSYSTGTVKAIGDNAYAVGGLVGALGAGRLSNSYATGSVSVMGNYATEVGGLVGYQDNASSLSNSYAAGSVNVTGDYAKEVGGLVGGLRSGTINNSYATGAVNVAGNAFTNVGGFAGLFLTGTAGNTGNYWNIQTAGMNTGIGNIPNPVAGSVTGLTTAQMMMPGSFVGWDIDTAGGGTNVWRIYAGSTAPMLKVFLDPVTITTASKAKTYDGTATLSLNLADYTYSITPADGGILGSGIAYLAYSPNAGTYADSNLSVLSGLYSNQQGYDIQFSTIGSSFVINPATLTYTAIAASRTYGWGNSVFNGDITGFVNGESLGTATTGTMSFATPATGASNVGAYAINGFGLTANNGNYIFAQASGNTTALTINPATLTLTANSGSKTYGDALVFSGDEFSVTGLQNGETVGSMSLTSAGAVATAGVGSLPYAIVGSNLVGGTFAPSNYVITYVDGALTVVPKGVTVTPLGGMSVYGESPSNPGLTAGGLVNGETVSALTGLNNSFGITPTTNTGSYNLSVIGTLTNPNYAITSLGNGTWTVSPALLNYIANTTSRAYGATNPTFSGTVTGFVNGETLSAATTGTLSFSTSATATSNVGSYAINGSGLMANNGNYTFAQAAGNATALAINPATLTVTANNSSKTYGDTAIFAGTEFTSSGLQNGETIGSATLASTGAVATADVNGSPYAITAANATGGTFNASNYAINYVEGALTLIPKNIIVTAGGGTSTYGQSPAGGGLTAVGLANGQDASVLTGLSANYPITSTTSVGSYTIAVNGALTNANYNVTAANAGTWLVNPALLTITASSFGKTYGDTFTFLGTEFTGSGLQNGETVGNVTLGSSGAVATANVAGSPYTITAAGATGGTFNASNYTISYVNGALTVMPKDISVLALSGTSTYGQSPTNPGFTASGLVNGETTAALTGLANSFGVTATTNAGTVATAVVGTLTNPNYNVTSRTAGAWTINPATLTVTANNGSKTYGDAAIFAGTEFASSGLQNGETIGTATLASTGAVATADVVGSPYAITASNATGGTFNANNYAISYVDGALTLIPKNIIVTAGGGSSTYGQNPAGGGLTASGLVNGQNASVLTGLSANYPITGTTNVGSYTIAVNGTLTNPNYNVTATNAGTWVVDPAALTITANSFGKTYGDTFTFLGTEFTGSGLQNGETVGSVNLASTGAVATANVAGSPYTITAAGATGGTFNASNYTISYVNGALTVMPKDISVLALGGTSTYGQNPTNPGFTASGLVNGETAAALTGLANSFGVTATTNAGTVATSVAGTLTNPNYNVISRTDGAWTINPATLTVTANSRSKTYGDTATFAGTEFTSTGLQNGETIGGANFASAGVVATADVNGSPYAITASQVAGGTFNPGNYTISFVDGALTLLPKNITVTAGGGTSIYGQTPAGGGLTANGLVNGQDTSVLTGLSTNNPITATTSVGSYAISVTGTLTNQNYNITTRNDGTWIVDPALLTYVANTANRTYGAVNPVFGGMVTGFMNGETVGTATTGTLSFTSSASGASPVGTYAINGSGLTAANYTFAQDTTNATALTINPAALTITANNQAKTYGYTLTFAGSEFNGSGLQNGETVGSVELASTGAVATAGLSGSPYAITAANATGGTFNASNYTINYVDGALTLTPKNISVTALGGTSIYGQNPANPGLSATGLVNGETVAVLTGLANGFGITNTTSAGGHALAVTGTLTNVNYNLTSSVDGLWTVNPAALTVTANNADKIYGGTISFTGTEFSSNGLQNGETIGSVNLASAGTVATAGVNGSPYAITASNATGGTFNASNYTIGYVEGALTVNPAALTITANNAVKTYGDTLSFAGSEFGSSGLQNGETIGSVNLASTGTVATASVNGSPYAITAANAAGGTFNAGNYATTYADGALVINPKAISVTALGGLSTYGQSPVNPGFTAAGLANGENVSVLTGLANGFGITGTTGVGNTTLSVVGALTNANYDLTTRNDGLWTVNPAALTITANNAVKTYGSTLNFTGSEFASAGLQNGETIGAVNLASAGTVATANVSNSPYVITAANATGGTFNAANYNISYADGTLTINPASLTYVANAASRTYGAANPVFSGTVTGFVNGETLGGATTGTLSFATPATVTSGVGGYAINGSGLAANNGNYTFVQSAGNATALTINPAALTITANNGSKIYGDTLNFAGTEFTTTALQNGETVGAVNLASAGALATANVNGSPYAITAAGATGGTFSAGNYAITYVNGALTLTPKAIAVTAGGGTSVYGQSPVGAGLTATGLANGQNASVLTGLSASTPIMASTGAGSYALSVTGALTNPNYTVITSNAGTWVVTPAALTITANNAQRDYGTANPAFSATYTGLVNGDTSGVVNGLTLTTPAVIDSPVGTYAIMPGGGSAANYTLSYVNGTLAVLATEVKIGGQVYQLARINGRPLFTDQYAVVIRGGRPTLVALTGSFVGRSVFFEEENAEAGPLTLDAFLRHVHEIKGGPPGHARMTGSVSEANDHALAHASSLETIDGEGSN